LIMGPNSREFVSITLHAVTIAPDSVADTISITEYQIPRAAKNEYEQGLHDRRRDGCTEALPHFQKALALYEKYSQALNELGSCFKEIGEFQKAEQLFRRAITYDSSINASM